MNDSMTNQFLEWFRNLNPAERELWKGTIDYLMGHSFLLRSCVSGLSTKKEEEYYRFLNDNVQFFSQYLSVMGGKIEVNGLDGIIRLSFPEHQGQRVFHKNQVLVLLLLKQVYQQKIRDFYSLSSVSITLDELMRMLQTREITISSSALSDYFRLFKRYRIAALVGEKGKEGIVIAKTIDSVLPFDTISEWNRIGQEEDAPSAGQDGEKPEDEDEEPISVEEEEAEEEKEGEGAEE